jgi:hypothetical protein
MRPDSTPIFRNARFAFQARAVMRAETQTIVEEIKRSVGLLRRHL